MQILFYSFEILGQLSETSVHFWEEPMSGPQKQNKKNTKLH